jgi:hypothetical protein
MTNKAKQIRPGDAERNVRNERCYRLPTAVDLITHNEQTPNVLLHLHLKYR